MERTNNGINVAKAKLAKQLLVKNLANIRSTTEWANYCNCSRTQLYRLILNFYGITPGEMMSKVRFDSITEILKKDPDTTSNYVAIKVGLRNEQGIYRFLSHRYNTNYTKLREQIYREILSEKHIE